MAQPGSSYEDSTRANDADRANVCGILDNAYANGELDGDEHRERCSSAMSAKTRGQLIGLISDLQPAQPTIAAEVNPNRKWIVGGIAGGGLVAVAVVVVAFVATWHGGSSPAPTAAVPARSETASSETGSAETLGTFLPLTDVIGTVSGDFQDQVGHAPERVNCPGDLAGQVGAFERCSIVDSGKRYTADLTVTAVNGNRITTHEAINEGVSSPPSRP
jgi:Domain of unknown function (DUF1707)/Domain of unknown function (DUF4333)